MAEGTTIRFTLNGESVEAFVGLHENVVEVLRREFDLFGARESCGQGLCGCCTVLVDGTAVSGCLAFAWTVDGKRVETVEGLSDGTRLDPVQRAYIDNAGFQCGFCTPGFILMTKQLLDAYPNPSDEQIREYLSGNLCRCGSYPDIIRSVRAAAAARAEDRTIEAIR